MREKAKAGDLKVVNGSQPKPQEKKKRRWDQAAGGDEPAKKKATSWDQAEVGTPSNVSPEAQKYSIFFVKCFILV